MNFPDNLLIYLIYALINYPGAGGIVVATLSSGLVIIFGLTLYWVTRDDGQSTELYAYPTPALHQHDHEPDHP